MINAVERMLVQAIEMADEHMAWVRKHMEQEEKQKALARWDHVEMEV